TRDHEQSVGRKECANGRALRLDIADADLSIDRKDERDVGVAGRPLGEEIEMAQLADVVTPELEAHRLRHPEAVDVEDSTAYAELGNVLHHRDALKADGAEVRGQLFGPP